MALSVAQFLTLFKYFSIKIPMFCGGWEAPDLFNDYYGLGQVGCYFIHKLLQAVSTMLWGTPARQSPTCSRGLV